MAQLIYALCAFTALLCSVLLLRGYRRTKARLLLWSGLCFVGLLINNILLILDRVMFNSVDLSLFRLISAQIALVPLLYGLIWEEA